MKKGYVHVGVVLDRSGSMSSILRDTINGYNRFLESQKGLEGEVPIHFGSRIIFSMVRESNLG